MNKILQIFSLAIITFLVACASPVVKKEWQLIEDFDQDILNEKFGIRFTVPLKTKLIHASVNDNENEMRIVYIGSESEGHFFLNLFKNYCNLNDIDPRYTWGHLKGCLATQMNSLKKENQLIVEKSHHVYAAQAIYFKPGSFVTPTTVFDKKVSYKTADNIYRFKSLGYAYKFNDSYYLIEIGYNTSEVDYDCNTKLFSEFIRTIEYP